MEAVRSDIARGKALQFLVDHATVVDENGEPIDLTFPETSPETSETADAGSSASSSTSTDVTEGTNATEERPEA